jgi:hypothetical protein
MNNSNSTNTKTSSESAAPKDMGFSPWERLKTKRISYPSIFLLLMATVVEFVILKNGWNYQRLVCLPQGMGVTLFGIGPIGATILAVELLKLPLAIWTASRAGWVKTFMIFCGLPLICVLTFQLVKDMGVYEMGVAMTPASQFLEKAAAEDAKIAHLTGELNAIDQKRVEREKKLADLAAKQSKTKSELEESLKRNDTARQDAISLTDYQKKELADVEMRQSGIIAQFNNDTAGLNKQLADLRAQREVEVARNTKWNAEEAKIENAYKTKKADWDNKKAQYDKDKTEYDNANFLKRQLLREPVSPGVPPERESNTVLKPTAVADIDAQIQTKEAELLAVNNKRRDRVAQVDADARRIREEYDQRSVSKREESDKKREELTAALTALATEEKAEREKIDKQFEGAAQNADGLRAEIDSCRKTANGYYEAREAAIRKTQVHRIATTVEIVRGLIKGERPMSIKATAKERGDILTDQISMVRIWVYPVLAFIVAFLPTLMVEIGFSTVFEPEQVKPSHRIGFLGRRLHDVYTRAGRIKIASYERTAKEATAQIDARTRALSEAKAAAEKTLAQAKAAAEKALSEKDAELQAAQEAAAAAEAKFAEEAKKKETDWTAKITGLADSLNRTVIEKDALRDLQKSEVDRQIQMRQNAWSDRITQLRQELDDERNAHETDRTQMMQAHHKKLMEVTEEAKVKVFESRRQLADAELATVDKIAKMEHALKDAQHARDEAESLLKRQTDTYALQMSQVQEEGTRFFEKATREEKHRVERQQMEFDKVLRQRDEEFEHRLKQREQELALAFEARLSEEKTKVEQSARLRQAEIERQIDERAREVEGRWKQDVQQREEAAQVRLKQREQALLAQADNRSRDAQSQAEEQFRRRETELEHQLEIQARDAETRFKQELQQKELVFQAKLKQRDQEFALKADSRETEMQKQWAADLRVREEEWQKQAEQRVRATESRLAHEAEEKEELFLSKSRQREEQWQVKLDAVLAELQSQTAAIEPYKERLARAEQERDEARQQSTESARHVQDMEKKFAEASSFLNGWKNGKRTVGA